MCVCVCECVSVCVYVSVCMCVCVGEKERGKKDRRHCHRNFTTAGYAATTYFGTAVSTLP